MLKYKSGCITDGKEIKRLKNLLDKRNKTIKLIQRNYKTICEEKELLKQQKAKLIEDYLEPPIPQWIKDLVGYFWTH